MWMWEWHVHVRIAFAPGKKSDTPAKSERYSRQKKIIEMYVSDEISS